MTSHFAPLQVSLVKKLKSQCGDRLHYALRALLLTKEDFIAMRLHDAVDGWFTDKDILTRLLGGLDGEKMVGVAMAYERKYSMPLWAALKENVRGLLRCPSPPPSAPPRCQCPPMGL